VRPWEWFLFGILIGLAIAWGGIIAYVAVTQAPMPADAGL
jgi:hypothetical protein